MLNLTIHSTSVADIQKSFERIALELIQNWHLKVKNELFSFTELEFYYFLEGLHEDNSTHKHKEPEAMWRFHNQGLDITFASSINSDGGILIRGLKTEKDYINGPRRVIQTLFKYFGNVTSGGNEFALVRKDNPSIGPIYKTTRHGLSEKQNNAYKEEHYRYYTDLSEWKYISGANKEKIREKSIQIYEQLI